MTNFEKHKDELLAFVYVNNTTPALVDGKFINCHSIDCSRCEFNSGRCMVRFVEWLYEDDGELNIDMRDCNSCRYSDKTSDEYPCSECRRSYHDKFELNPKKTRLLEFLEHYPNAELDSNGIPKILPCRIDKTYLMKCSSSECGMCERAYWLQEVIE